MSESLEQVRALIGRARRRLRLRRVVGSSAVGLQLGLAGAAVVAAAVKLLFGSLGIAALAAVGVVAGCVAVGALVGMLRPNLAARELALLVDRLSGTDELLITATWLADLPDHPHRRAVLDQLEARLSSLPPLAKVLPVRWPSHLRYSVALLLAAVLALFLPPLGAGRGATGPPSALAEEGIRLEERLDDVATEYEAELPVEISSEVARLAEDLQADELSEEDARERLDALKQKLQDHIDTLAASQDLLQDLEDAAKELDEAATEQLAEALEAGDMDAAAAAARDLAEQLETASPEERQRAADALMNAGEELQQSGDEQLRQAGEALERAGQSMQGAQQGSQSPGTQAGKPEDQAAGEPGQQDGSPQEPGQGTSQAPPPQSGGLSQEQAQQLAEQLQQAQQLGERLQRDQQSMEQSQRMNGALESSSQALGGESQAQQGQSSQGQGQGQGQGEGEGATGSQGSAVAQGTGLGSSQPGQGHTWEDEGESESLAGHQDADRQSGRTEGLEVDDFEQIYKSVRLDGTQPLVTGVSGELDESGQIDELPTRLTGAEENARTGLVDLPPGYRDAADQALTNEQIPPGYREAVKTYFDTVENGE